MSWKLVYTKRARKDAKKAAASGLKANIRELLNILSEDPYISPPPYKKLVGDFTGAFSRRINIQHRLVYQIIDDKKIVKILSMWSHYDG